MKGKSIFSSPGAKVEKPLTPVKASLFCSPVEKRVVEKGTTTLFASATIRQRIQVVPGDLDKYSANANSKKKAVDLILHTNADNLKLDYVMSIGKPEQERHAIIAERCFKLSMHSALTVCQTKLGRLIELIDGSDHPSQAGFMSKIGFFKEKIQEKFEDGLENIKQISEELKVLTDDLIEVTRNCKELVREINDLTNSLEPIIISCQFFSEYQKDNFPSVLYVSRLTGLLNTATTAKQNIIQVQTLEQTVVQLVDTIAHVVLTDIPQWMTNLTNDQQRKSILSKLKQHHGKI